MWLLFDHHIRTRTLARIPLSQRQVRLKVNSLRWQQLRVLDEVVEADVDGGDHLVEWDLDQGCDAWDHV